MKKIFVTGINGLLGTNLLNLLLKEGYFVKGQVRNIDSYNGKRNENLELIRGTLFDDYTKTLIDVDCVVHIAAVTSQSMLDYSYYWRVNSFATQQIYQTAVKCGVKKFIFVSTANTLGYGSNFEPGTEKSMMREPFKQSIYALSKKSAEDYILNDKAKIDAVIVNPTFMLGAFDSKPSSGKILLMSYKKRFILYPPGGKNFVHVEDVANGILKAIKNGRNGEKYLLSNENLSYHEFFKKVSVVAKEKPLFVKIPKPLLSLVGLIGDLLRFLKVETNMSSVNMRILGINNYYSNDKSVSELGLNYQPVDKAISDAVNYFLATNKIK